MTAYLDNAATTPLCVAAKTAIAGALNLCGNPSSSHAGGRNAKALLESSRRTVANALKAKTDEVFFTGSGTESNNIAIFGTARALKRRGNRIVTTAIEHASVIEPLKQLEADGFEVVYLSPDSSGTVSLSAFSQAINEDTILVSCMSVNNETGAMLPVSSLAELIKTAKSPALLHIDASQSFLKHDLSPADIQADLLTVSAHKIHGATGVGALYKREGARILPRTFGGGQERELRPGTESLPLIAGFAAAVADFGEREVHKSHVRALREKTVAALVNFDDICLNSPQNTSEYILNFSILGIKSEVLLNFLSERGVYISSGSACAKGKISHVLRAMQMDKTRADGAVRVSFSKFSTVKECEMLIEGIIAARKTLLRSTTPPRRGAAPQ